MNDGCEKKKKNESRFEFPLYLIDGSQHIFMAAVADIHIDSMVGKVLWTDKWNLPLPCPNPISAFSYTSRTGTNASNIKKQT